ncbi:MAG: phage head closure protein [Lachnotalea sp.]
MYLTIQKRKKEVVKGRSSEEWTDYYSPWCDIKNLYGKELYNALEVDLKNVINFETRFCNKLDALNTKEYRIKWGERIFNLINVDYLNYKKNKIVLKGQEVV